MLHMIGIIILCGSVGIVLNLEVGYLVILALIGSIIIIYASVLKEQLYRDIRRSMQTIEMSEGQVDNDNVVVEVGVDVDVSV